VGYPKYSSEASPCLGYRAQDCGDEGAPAARRSNPESSPTTQVCGLLDLRAVVIPEGGVVLGLVAVVGCELDSAVDLLAQDVGVPGVPFR